MDRLTRRYRAAVGTALVTLDDLASASGYATPTLKMYLYSERPVSTAAAEGMATALEAHAREITRRAEQLREVVGEARGESRPSRGRRIRR